MQVNMHEHVYLHKNMSEHEFDGKVRKILHPITYVSGLFKGSQVNWATLTKEAYDVSMSVCQ